MALATFLALAFTPFPNLLARSRGGGLPAQFADAIVVLGGRMQPGGILGPDSFRRTVEGAVLYRRGLAPLLVFSGATRTDGEIPENTVRLALARDLGIPTGAILIDSGSSTTRDEARRLWEALSASGRHRILLVTDSQHLRRAAPLFTKVGFQVQPVAADYLSPRVSDPDERLHLAREAAQEWAAWVYYRVAGYL